AAASGMPTAATRTLVLVSECTFGRGSAALEDHGASAAGSGRRRTGSDLPHLGFLVLQKLFQLLDVPIGELLDFVLLAAPIVLRNLVVLLAFLDFVVRLFTRVPDRYPSLLRHLVEK